MSQRAPAVLALSSGGSVQLFPPETDASLTDGADVLVVIARVDTETVRARCRRLSRNGWLVVLVAGDEQVDQVIWIVGWVAERAAALGSPSRPLRVAPADEAARGSLHRIRRVFPEAGWPPVRVLDNLTDNQPNNLAARSARSQLHEEDTT